MGPILHYRAVVELVTARGLGLPSHSAHGDELDAEPYRHATAEIYRSLLFHGPTLHGIDTVLGTSELGASATVLTSSPSAFGIPSGRWRTDPLAVDALLQLMLLWVRERRGSGALPTALGVFRWFGEFAGTLTCHLRMEDATARGGRFSATWMNPWGQIVATLDGGEYTADPSLLRTIAPGSPSAAPQARGAGVAGPVSGRADVFAVVAMDCLLPGALDAEA